MKPHYLLLFLLLLNQDIHDLVAAPNQDIHDLIAALHQDIHATVQDIHVYPTTDQDSQGDAGENGDIQILGLFKDKVVLQIQGKTSVLKIGDDKDGIQLLSADSKQCTLLVHGHPQVFSLGSQVSVNFTPTQQPKVRIVQDDRGLYRVSGAINGQNAKFIVDTGASIVAMNTDQAANLGISYSDGKLTQIHTAGTSTRGYLIVLREVKIGAIKVLDVPAVVVENSELQEVLLGRTFLNRLEMTDQDRILELKQKY